MGRNLLRQSVTAPHLKVGPYSQGGAVRAMGRVYPQLGAIWPMRYAAFETTNTAVQAHIEQDEPQLWKCIRHFNPKHPEATEDNEWSVFALDQELANKTLANHAEQVPKVTALKDALISWGVPGSAPKSA